MGISTLEAVEATQYQVVDLALRSETFQNAPVCCALLQYLYQHRNEQIGEYAIGTEALARRESFDPKSDSYVRVQISRLRTKLAEFSAKEGKEAPLQIVVPRGSYKIEFVDQPATADEKHRFSAERPASPSSTSVNRAGLSAQPVLAAGRGKLIFGLSVSVAALACSLAISVSRQWRGVTRSSADSNMLQAKFPSIAKDSFWGSFLANGRSVRIVVPNPIFYLWKDAKTGDSINVRSIRSNDFDDLKQSAMLAQLEEKYGQPMLSQEYLSTYDTMSAFTLASFLRDNGFRADLSSSDALSLGAIDRETLILMGTVQTLQPYQKYFRKLTLSFTSAPQTISSRDSSTGKSVEYNPVIQSSDHVIIPQLLACLPGSTPNGRILLIEGYKDIASVAYITSREGQDELQRLQKENHGNPFFEAVVMSEINGDIPIKSRIAIYKPIAENK